MFQRIGAVEPTPKGIAADLGFARSSCEKLAWIHDFTSYHTHGGRALCVQHWGALKLCRFWPGVLHKLARDFAVWESK